MNCAQFQSRESGNPADTTFARKNGGIPRHVRIILRAASANLIGGRELRQSSRDYARGLQLDEDWLISQPIDGVWMNPAPNRDQAAAIGRPRGVPIERLSFAISAGIVDNARHPSVSMSTFLKDRVFTIFSNR